MARLKQDLLGADAVLPRARGAPGADAGQADGCHPGVRASHSVHAWRCSCAYEVTVAIPAPPVKSQVGSLRRKILGRTSGCQCMQHALHHHRRGWPAARPYLHVGSSHVLAQRRGRAVATEPAVAEVERLQWLPSSAATSRQAGARLGRLVWGASHPGIPELLDVYLPYSCAMLQELFKPGSNTSATAAEVKRDATAPFISGHFEYGLGRAAGQRHVFLFIGRSQDHDTQELDTNVTFLGIYKTNRAVNRMSHCFTADNER